MPRSRTQSRLNARWAIAQTLISALVLFLLYRFLLHELGAAKLGLWSLILASVSLVRIGELGFSSAALRFVGKYVGEDRRDLAAEVLETSIISICLPLGVLFAVAVPLVESGLNWFVPEQHLLDAAAVLPWAMLSLWVGVASGMVQSAVDGVGRMDQKNIALIIGNVIYLAASVVLAPTRGLSGVAIAQCIQAGFTLVCMWYLVKGHLPHLRVIPLRWNIGHFREILQFGVTMQVGSVAGMFIEPITKAMISHFSGLEFLGYYEMANQMITRARGVLVSGFQAVVPLFAMEKEPEVQHDLFVESQENVITLGIPYMALVMIAFPVVSLIWIGRDESAFVISGQLLGTTWLLLTLLMPGYFYLSGTGRGIPIAVAHLIALAGTLGFGWLGGVMFGQFGVIVGAGMSLLIGNVIMYLAAWSRLRVARHTKMTREWIGRKGALTAGACMLLVGTNLIAVRYASDLFARLAILAVLAVMIGAVLFTSRRASVRAGQL